MTPTLYPIQYQQARMMDRGTFTLFHAWDLGDGYAVEYWRGIDNNGACLRTLLNGHMVSITHYATPGAAIRVLLIGGCPVPGVPPLDPDRQAEAVALHRRQLQSHHVTHR